MVVSEWHIRAYEDEIDEEHAYANDTNLFSIKIHHGGYFTNPPNRQYKKGTFNYFDMVDVDLFSVVDLNDMGIGMELVSGLGQGTVMRRLDDILMMRITLMMKLKLPEEYLENIDKEVEWVWLPKNDGKRKKALRKLRREHEANRSGDTDSSDAFYVGRQFTDKKSIKEMVYSVFVATRRQLYIWKNDKHRVRVVCRGKTPVFTYPTVNGPNGSSPSKLKNIGGKWVKEKGASGSSSVVNKESGMMIKLFKITFQKISVDVSEFSKIYRSKRTSKPLKKKVKGDYTHQYALLRDYALELQRTNHDTTVKIDIERCCDPTAPERQFKRIYASLTGDVLLNNICEVFNRQLLDGRDVPILTCLEFVREYLMKRIVNVQKVIEKCNGPLTPASPHAAVLCLSRLKLMQNLAKVTWNGGHKYGVVGPSGDQVVVDVHERTCSCRKWELTRMPYKHALASIWNMATNNMDVGTPKSWVHTAYWLVTWQKVYSFKINPLNGKHLWSKHPSPNILIPPKHHPQVGRPPKKRKKSASELSSQQMVDGGKLSRVGKSVTCCKCHKTGHNKRTCTGRQEPTSGAKKVSAKSKGKQPMNEVEVISEIVTKVLRDMPDALPTDVFSGLVGMESRVDEVKRILSMESREVLFVGICRMSGIGKTTLAEAVFNNIQEKFERRSFIENIKDISKQDDSTDLCKLQQKLLDNILKEKSVCVQSVKHGQTLLGTKLLGLKVMIVLDDVNHPGQCEEMNNDDALRLFIHSAFEHGPPTDVYEKWSDDIVKLAGGLPLALNCKDRPCGKTSGASIVPVEKPLGKPLVQVSSPQGRYLHQRFSHRDDACTFESSTIRIINQEQVEMDDSIDDPYCFSIMKRLKFLRISNVRFPQGLSYLSNDLRILEWFECSLKSLPSNFKPTHMYELEMCYSQLKTLWEKHMVLPNLRSIDLSFSKDLIKIPDLTSTPKLVKLNLEGCTNLKELHESVLLQKSLQYVYLTGCTHLQSLGRSNMEMESLVTLLLSGCSRLESIPEFGENMKRLEHLYVDGTSIKKLPESLGKLCNLRKLDASETCIKEIPSSIHNLKRLRRLRLHRCPLSSQRGGFLFTNVDILSGLRELDLSYCNLSVVPAGIGLLHRLISLDLSGNEFVQLSASISLLSNLKMLCLNNCKRLQSLPKLSIVNKDSLSGLPIRFDYIISGEEVDVSIHHAASNDTNPTISCLNCPNLAKSRSGCYLAEHILHSYLQLRTKCWMTPVAVFEIVGAGSEIPPGFVLPGSDYLIPKNPWIGVAICAVIAVDIQTRPIAPIYPHYVEYV
ncbi:NB-ARC domains-containing protein [Tanacetum coccineum]